MDSTHQDIDTQIDQTNVKQEHHEQPTAEQHNQNNQSNNTPIKQELNKSPITLQQIKQVHATMKTTFKNRSVAGLVIALYDYLKLWTLPSRQQKMKELMQQQMMQTNNMVIPAMNSMNGGMQPQYNYPQQMQQMPTQQYQPIQPNTMQPYMMANNNQQPILYMQPYPAKPRGRGRPPKHGIKEQQMPQMNSMPRMNQMMQPKTKEEKEKVLAEIFLYRGYGIGNAKAEVTFPMDANVYYTYMRSILFRGFAKLEDIVATECKVQVTPSEDYKSIKFRSELCKCEKWMQRSELKTYQEYIRSVYELNPQAVSKGDTIRLYRVILARWQQVKVNHSRVQDESNGMTMSRVESMM